MSENRSRAYAPFSVIARVRHSRRVQSGPAGPEAVQPYPGCSKARRIRICFASVRVRSDSFCRCPHIISPRSKNRDLWYREENYSEAILSVTPERFLLLIRCSYSSSIPEGIGTNCP